MQQPSKMHRIEARQITTTTVLSFVPLITIQSTHTQNTSPETASRSRKVIFKIPSTTCCVFLAAAYEKQTRTCICAHTASHSHNTSNISTQDGRWKGVSALAFTHMVWWMDATVWKIYAARGRCLPARRGAQMWSFLDDDAALLLSLPLGIII